jgi:hypothetical protein
LAAGTGKKPAEVESETVLAWVTQSTPPVVSTQRQDSGRNSGEAETVAEDHNDNRQSSRDDDREEAYDDRGPMGFSDRDRQIIGDCLVNDRAGLPPGLAKKDRLPPGLERQIQRKGTLPPGLQKRAQRLPASCEARLPSLPNDWVRVAVSGRVILLNSRERIVDLFWLDRD